MTLSFAKSRILLSRVAAVVILILYLFSESRWETHAPLFSYLLFLSGLILVGIGSLGRMWCSLYIAGYKDNTLITQGPYSMTRNPLYFFSFLGLLGIGLATETLTFPLIFLLFFALGYPRVIATEERKLRKLFGEAYEEYARRVPAFFPKISLLQEPESYSVRPKVYRKHMLSALWFIWIVGILELIEGLRELGSLPTYWMLY
jgi:protein-S-isoprenylcysteine O-methyltransferase Ste14